jgi:Reverse transcriptase (RNA-dependent DNA polymerase)
MMGGVEHKQEWLNAMNKEIQELIAKDAWEEIPKTQATGKIIPLVWVLRRKRAPSGEFKKFKARMCCRGDLMPDDLETFSPVAQWSTVRCFLVLAMTLGWKTVLVDWANAFIQSKLEEPIFVHLPRRFSSTLGSNTCLKL